MKLDVLAGTTSKLVNFYIQDSTRGDGSGLTGLTSSSSGLTCYYYRSGAGSSTAVSLTSMTLGTWVSGGFVAVDGNNMPGLYQLGIPNAALATSATNVTLILRGATNMMPVLMEIELTAYDPYNATNMGLTALPAATAGATGGLLINEHINDSVSSGSPAAGSFAGSGSLSASDSFYVGSVLAFTSGTLKGIARKVTSYTGSSKTFGFTTAFPTAPATSDTFIIIGRIDS